ncbi:MAG: ABC transporter ATP-binding protein [Armatimonadetes bacterium JP3_11]|jgi:iron complex transport system ATP-binding protein|nr:MAG: ABC transporter ATP-binding protein [Armatimonadetes bacterium CP1_7O]OYT74748.1 MAG: ABC transporter ATP-binding protein [Armatimonadetes bacterium JP3_11]RMH10719.1 MAG: ABC transporter ATP-binding protein [Armatimonadota bacterium]
MLVAESITVGYQQTPVVHDASVQVAPGQIVVLLGPNGSGKTTLLRTLARILTPLRGKRLLEGKPYEDYSLTEFARQVAYAPQETPTEMGFTVAELVMMGRYPHQKGFWGVSRADRNAVRRAMEQTAIAHLAERTMSQLSGGERQRVNLARALAQEARYLILDEPTTHLDLHHQTQLMHMLRQHAQVQGAGVLLVLHDLNLASQYADWIVLISEGQIVAQGTPDAVLQPMLLERVYHTPVLRQMNPLTGRPLLFALSADAAPHVSPDAPHAFVIAGGGSGAALYYALLAAGWRVSTGVLNLLDTDEEIARALKLEHITEPPFSPISDEAYQRAQQLVASADAVVIADTPFGHGNLRNLQLALWARTQGVPIYALAARPIEQRDFTNGEATRLWHQLLDHGMHSAACTQEILSQLEPHLKARRDSPARA